MNQEDIKIILDINEATEGQSNVQRAMLLVLKHILVELRIANGRSGDTGDANVRKGAETALKQLSNYRV